MRQRKGETSPGDVGIAAEMAASERAQRRNDARSLAISFFEDAVLDALQTDIVVTSGDGDDETIQSRFDRFHQDNPHIFWLLHRMAMMFMDAGANRWSVRDGFGMLRFGRVAVGRTDDYVFNNDYTSRYALLLIGYSPALADIIETREIRTL